MSSVHAHVRPELSQIQLPTLDVAQVSDARLAIGLALLGDQALLPKSSKTLTDGALKFIDALLAMSWNRYRKSIAVEIPRANEWLTSIRQTFDSKYTHIFR